LIASDLLPLTVNHRGAKRQVGLRAIVDEITGILRVYLKSSKKAIILNNFRTGEIAQ
jgi:hypothetical protein